MQKESLGTTILIKLTRSDPPGWKKAIKHAGGVYSVHARAWEVHRQGLSEEWLKTLKTRIWKERTWKTHS